MEPRQGNTEWEKDAIWAYASWVILSRGYVYGYESVVVTQGYRGGRRLRGKQIVYETLFSMTMSMLRFPHFENAWPTFLKLETMNR